MHYINAVSSLAWFVNGPAGSSTTLNSASLVVNETTLQSSDKRLKFNEKTLTRAFDVINKLEPLEYDQTLTSVGQYTPDTPQSHHCGYISESIQ